MPVRLFFQKERAEVSSAISAEDSGSADGKGREEDGHLFLQSPPQSKPQVQPV